MDTWEDNTTNWGMVAIPTTWINKIEKNQKTLHGGNGYSALTTIEVDASFVLDIGATDQTFFVSGGGGNYLKYITTLGRQPGNTIHLIKKTVLSKIYHNSGSIPENTLPILSGYSGEYNENWEVNRLVTLVLGTAGWHYDFQ